MCGLPSKNSTVLKRKPPPLLGRRAVRLQRTGSERHVGCGLPLAPVCQGWWCFGAMQLAMIVLSAVLCQSIRHAMRKMFPEICVLHMLRKLRWFRWRLNLRRETEKASLHNAWRARDVRVDCVQRKPRMKDIHTTCQAEPCTESQQFPVAHRFSGTVRRFSKLWNPGFSVNLLYRLLVVSLESRTVEIVERPHSRVNTCSPRQLCDLGSDKTFYRPEGSGLGQLSAS